MKKDPNAKAARKEKWRTSHWAEVFRFIIVGVLCTVIDFAVGYVLRFAFVNNLNAVDGQGNYLSTSGHYIATAICIAAGFIVSVIVNYFLSKYWVFQNVERDKKTQRAKWFWIYVALAFGGFLLGIGLMVLGEFICNSAWDLRYPVNPFDDQIWGELFGAGGIAFWAYVIVFVIKTIIVLVYNYVTRKFIVFREPKKQAKVEEAPVEEPIVNPAVVYNYTAETETFEVKKKDKVRTEVDIVYCKPQFNWGKPISKDVAKRQVYASLEVFDPRKTSVSSTKRNKEIIVEEIRKADAKKAKR